MTLNVIPMPNNVEYYGGEVSLKEMPVEYATDEKLSDEEYVIEISRSKVYICTNGEKSKHYAMQTFSRILEKETAPLCRIKDKPAYPYRGFMIDSARHMQTVDELKKYITAAAEFRFNVFHWHLCDDQGWRIESETFPELCQKGAYRDCHGFGSPDGREYGGYYTKDEIRDIVAFCKAHYIDVIPEIDMPGHTTAIISTYPELSCRGEQIPVATEGGIFRDIMCAGNEKVYEFCFRLLDEVCDLFPYGYFHVGGDEAPKSRWCNCEKCQAKIKKENLRDVEELQGYFTNRIVSYLEDVKGKKVFAWNECLNSGVVKDSVIISDWMDKQHRCEAYANNGGKIIIEDFHHYYLDYTYGVTPLRKTYNYSTRLEKLNEQGRKNVLGIETPVWTEYIEDFDRMCYMCFPRLIACGEAGWTEEENKNYRSFLERVRTYDEKLTSYGVKMAHESEWDPGSFARVRDMFDRIVSCLNPEAIKVTLFPNKE